MSREEPVDGGGRIFGFELQILMPPVPLLVLSEYALLSLVEMVRRPGAMRRRAPKVTVRKGRSRHGN